MPRALCSRPDARAREDMTNQPAPPDALVWDRLARVLSPVERCPRIVVDVEYAHQAWRDGTPYVVIHNQDAGTYLKLDPREAELLPLMDGTRSIKTLAVEFYQRHGQLVLPRIAALVNTLRNEQFLEERSLDLYGRLDKQLQPVASRFSLALVVQAFLHTRWNLPEADGALTVWYGAWGWALLSTPMLVLGTLMGIVSPLLFLFEMQRGRYNVLAFATSSALAFVALLVLNLLAIAVHELGHALAVKRAGRRVRHAGVLLYYGMPVPFVDTSDLWMAERRARVLGSYAGPWSGFLLGGAALVLAALLPTSTAGALLFTWGSLFVLLTVRQFNPLLELDGYYLLVDWLEKPMLRARALGFVRGPLWQRIARRERLTGEEWFLAAFGSAAMLFSVFYVVVVFQFWRGQISPIIGTIWASGNVPVRVGLLVIAVAVGTPIALVVWSALRGMAGLVRPHLARLRRGRLRHRRARALAVLRAVPSWSDLPEAVLLESAGALHEEAVSPGTEIVRQGEAGDQFYIVESGSFEVLVNGEPVAVLGPGDYFGERALLQQAPRAATVVATSASELFWMDQQAFHASLAADVAVGAALAVRVAYRTSVAEMTLFGDLTPSELDALLARMDPITVEAGAEIIRQGDLGERFYVIYDGRVEVVRDGQPLATLERGEAFGEIALLLDVPRTATVRAVERTELLALEAADFRDLLAGYCQQEGALRELSSRRLQQHGQANQVVA